jgi:hypothetical protein
MFWESFHLGTATFPWINLAFYRPGDGLCKKRAATFAYRAGTAEQSASNVRFCPRETGCAHVRLTHLHQFAHDPPRRAARRIRDNDRSGLPDSVPRFPIGPLSLNGIGSQEIRIMRYAATLSAVALAFLAAPAGAQLDGTMPAAAARIFASSAPGAVSNGAVVTRSWVDAGGTTINEYATSTGKIFAYTWSGPTSPDLRQLLGTHFSDYQSGAALARGQSGLHAGRVAQSGFVVEAGGRMRGYTGRAWLPDAVPAGVSIDDLR